jgi:hypothetical protein
MPEISRDRPSNGITALSEQAVREELQRVLASTEFHSSKRCQEFLRYVIDAALAGHADELKERTIGIQLFGRPVSYEPTTDATVRVKAGEVRKRLSLYYAGAGSADPVRIDLPAGGYVPEFTASGSSSHQRPSESRRPLWRRPALWLASIAGVGIVAAGLAIGSYQATSDSALRRFWAPALRSKTPVLLSLSQVPVYGLDPDVEVSRKPPARLEDFILLKNHFVGGGDVLALGRLTSLLSDLRQSYTVRLGHEVSFHDLRDSPSVLLGYSYTEWHELSKELRFLIDTSRRPPAVTDNGRRTGWVLENLQRDRSTDSDYAIVSRLLRSDTGALLVIIAGVTQFGTEAAADLVTDRVRLNDALRTAAPGWERKNLQLILKVRVISGVPAPAAVVALHSW